MYRAISDNVDNVQELVSHIQDVSKQEFLPETCDPDTFFSGFQDHLSGNN